MKVVVTRKIPQVGIDILEKRGYEIDYNKTHEKLPYNELIERCKDADGVISILNDRIDANFISKCKQLKIIANHAVGYENIDIDVASQRGIWVNNTPDVLTNATADFAFTMLLAIARRFIEGHNYLREGKFDGWQTTLLLGSEISGKTLGIIGAGRIGSAVIRRAFGFDMNVLYYNRSTKPELDAMGCKQVELDQLLQESDFVSLHLPGGSDTHHIINRKRLLAMKPNAYLINTGRGNLIDENALVNVLQDGHLGGVALDVFEEEPKIHPDLLDFDNVILQPHIGSATIFARDSMSTISANAIIDVFEGRKPKHPVNSIGNH